MNALRDVMPVIEEYLQGAGGLRILVRSWLPDRPPVASVAIVPGFNSHGGYYVWAAAQLVASGFAVHAVDLRGRGKSDGERFYLERFDDYLGDVRLLLQRAKHHAPDRPVFLLGHSAGGVIASSYTVEHQDELAGLVCESFAFQVPGPAFALTVLKGLSHLAPRLRVLKLPNAEFSRDPEVVDAMNNDPLIAGENQPAHTVAEMVRANERLRRNFPRIRIPVMILHGKNDKVTMPPGSQFFFDTVGSSDKTLKLYDGHVHDLLADLGKQQVLGDIRSWLLARV